MPAPIMGAGIFHGRKPVSGLVIGRDNALFFHLAVQG